MRALSLTALAVIACSDDPPSISMLLYSPNAGFAGEQTTINGMFNYADQDNDISQWQAELVDPNNNLLQRTPPTPIANTDAGVTGQVSFTLMLTPPVVGLYRFNVWCIDLMGRPSNKLGGLIRVDADTSQGP